ncbi:hypothetical protein [Parasedimentitalea psychrophila]|uniref:Uncharacterized protein n=1 Tax=Parasedimentitalea psychrophila TaxID=2997337 RepID=A0A9Y2P3P1_9RHOB|nr:hypothetical protein [Parasedimentitalea psychrophila]WIY24479.1 hypothetical protein QPJ95_18260 [Parasedimentitalea psychrophila]
MDAMPAQFETNICAPATGAQEHREMTGDATTTTEPFGLRAAWLHFANQIEIRRLAKLHVRIERKKAALAELVGERHTIMRRRMRRAGGKH